MTGVIWNVENTVGHYIIWAVFFLGWATVLVGMFLINHFDLFGLRQVYLYQHEREYTELGFRTPFLYKVVRHPIMLGFIIAFWATPRMTVGHLVFAIATTAYMLIAIQLEERDIKSIHGTAYEEYRQRVSMLLPFPKGSETGKWCQVTGSTGTIRFSSAVTLFTRAMNLHPHAVEHHHESARSRAGMAALFVFSCHLSPVTFEYVSSSKP